MNSFVLLSKLRCLRETVMELLNLFDFTHWELSQFASALFSIILIDLVLAGDNAVVIALAAHQLPQHLRRKAIYWGTLGAIITRILMTILVIQLLKIPGLHLIGGILLIWIAYRLLADNEASQDKKHAKPVHTLWQALRTIIIADTIMGVDNVLGVAGAARSNVLLVIVGLIISIPIMVSGARLILNLMERFSFIIQIGAAVLAYTAAYMITADPIIHRWLDLYPGLYFLVYMLVFGLTFLQLLRKKIGLCKH